MGRPLVMGVLNVTPDSFSDGGQWFSEEAAVAHGMEMFRHGADVVDVGGESTRPGAEPVAIAEELRRVVPVVAALSRHGRVSVDTSKREVAEAAVSAGATFINDVSASLYAVAAASGAGWAAMHMQGTPRTMQRAPKYDDVVMDVRDFLVARAEVARGKGVDEIWIDPGIGFGKTPQHNVQLLRHIGVFVDTGYPVLVGTSRKSFLSRILGGAPSSDVLEGSLATATHAMACGAAMVRVHDVAATVQAARLVGDEVAP